MLHELFSDTAGLAIIASVLGVLVLKITGTLPLVQRGAARFILRKEQQLNAEELLKLEEERVRNEYRLRELPLELQREADLKAILHEQTVQQETARLEAIKRNRMLMLRAFRHKASEGDFEPMALPKVEAPSAGKAGLQSDPFVPASTPTAGREATTSAANRTGIPGPGQRLTSRPDAESFQQWHQRVNPQHAQAMAKSEAILAGLLGSMGSAGGISGLGNKCGPPLTVAQQNQANMLEILKQQHALSHDTYAKLANAYPDKYYHDLEEY